MHCGTCEAQEGLEGQERGRSADVGEPSRRAPIRCSRKHALLSAMGGECLPIDLCLPTLSYSSFQVAK